MIHVVSAKYIDNYTIELIFNDGKKEKVNLYDVIYKDHRTVFSELKDINKFKKFKVDFDTIVWTNGLDIAPEFLYFKAFEKNPDLQNQFKQWGYV